MAYQEAQGAYSEYKQKAVQKSCLYADGFLYLEGDPGSWIQRFLSLCSFIRILELCNLKVNEIGDSISELAKLTLLSIYDSPSLKCVINISRLHNLQVLKIVNCVNLEELPENLGELKNLTHLELSSCSAIKSLPVSITESHKLSTLKVENCVSLTALQLPVNCNVRELKLSNCCTIQSIPSGLTNLERLDIQLCGFSEGRFSNSMDAKRLRQLTISVCRLHPVEEMPVDLNEFVSLENLYIQTHIHKKIPSCAEVHNLQRLRLSLIVEELPIDLNELPQLLILDIHECYNIKYLPRNIKNLLNLHSLLLPSDFRLETLLFHLNDSVIISVEGKHIRKTWEELKLDMGPLFAGASLPMVEMVMDAAENTTPLISSGYLSLKDDPSTWIMNHFKSWCMVRILDIKLPSSVKEIGDVIGALPNLTSFYISATHSLQCLPVITTRLTHLSLKGCDLHLLSDSLGKLSNLKSLNLCLEKTEFPAALDLLHCLEHLTLRHCKNNLLPDSVAKLPNLNTLELYRGDECDQFSLPVNLNLTKLKLVCCYVESLPTSLCHLEIVHDSNYCLYDCNYEFRMCLEQLVNLKTFSLTCYRVKFRPKVGGQHSLQTLVLKDCLGLRELPPNVDELVELRTLDISGTKIKSLPECITKLPKLQRLVLPKCFKQNNMPSNFESFVNIEFDCVNEKFEELYNEDNVNTPSSLEGLDYVVFKPSEEEGGVTSSYQLPNPTKADHGSIEGYEETAMTSSNQLNSSSYAHDGNNHHAGVHSQNSHDPHGAHKKGKKQMKEITLEQIESMRVENMTLVEAANKLGVSRSTMKRRCKEFKLGVWPQSKNNKSNCTKKRRINGNQCLDGNKHNLADPVVSISDFFDRSTLNATTECVRELPAATHRHMDVLESAPESAVGTEVHTLLSYGQDGPSSRSFDIKVIHKEDIVRFEWSSTACLEELKNAVAEHLKIAVESFKLNYLDEEEDWVLINSNQHFKKALSFIKNHILKLKVIDL